MEVEMTKRGYGGWALSLIALICADEQVSANLKVEEIKCVVHHDGSYSDNFEDGDTPAEAWDSEKEAIKDSQ